MSILQDKTGIFKAFPEFSPLTINDRARFETFTRTFPPLSDLGFPTLMFWWNSMDSCAVSELNSNLVISYWLPGVESFSGLALIGNDRIEQSMCEIFDWQRSNGEKPRLSHVPEFVVKQIGHPELFKCAAEREFDEYIFDIERFYPLSNVEDFRRKRIQTFMRQTDNSLVEVKALDFDNEASMRLILQCIKDWRKTGHLNDSVALEVDAIHTALLKHAELGIRNLCLFVDGELEGFCLYYVANDSRYVVVTNARMNTAIPWTFDYCQYAFSQEFASMGIERINMECDLGSELMRTLKLSLGPTEFFRKYTIEPVA